MFGCKCSALTLLLTNSLEHWLGTWSYRSVGVMHSFTFHLWQLVINQLWSNMQKWVVKSSRADGSWGCKCVWRLSHPLLQGTSKAFSAIVSLVLLSRRACCLNSLLESVHWGAVEGSQDLYWFNSEAPWKSAITKIKPWAGWWDGICAWKYLNARMFFISFSCTKQHSD